MSNTLAIASVSGVLTARIRGLLDDAGLSGFTVTAGHPTQDSSPGVYLHLYQILPNGHLRNETLPERSADGTVLRPARLAVDLHLLFTFVGEAATFDGERLAGVVMTGLNEFPTLSRAEIADYLGALPAGHVLAGADLGDQLEHVRLTPESMDLEALSRLWGMYGQSQHQLSVAYQASVVMLDAEVEHAAPLPATRPALTTFLLRVPRIGEVRSSARAQPVVRFEEELVVRGSALRGDRTMLRIGDAMLPAADPGDVEIRQPFDAAAGLASGLAGLQVVHEIVLADGSARAAGESNTLPVALVPTVTPASPSTVATGDPDGNPLLDVRLEVAPLPAAAQRVALLLVGTAGEGRSTWDRWRVDDGALVFTTTGLPAGTYLVRLEVDGAVTLLDVDATGAFTGPAVTVS
jgi:hypothetical protein